MAGEPIKLTREEVEKWKDSPHKQKVLAEMKKQNPPLRHSNRNQHHKNKHRLRKLRPFRHLPNRNRSHDGIQLKSGSSGRNRRKRNRNNALNRVVGYLPGAFTKKENWLRRSITVPRKNPGNRNPAAEGDRIR